MFMIKSSKPRYQRRFRFNAPLHARQHFMHAHLDKALRAKLKLKKRAVQISKGDTVKVMAGSKAGTSGKVTMVNLRSGKIAIDSLVRKNARGKESPILINVSNVYITDLNLSDKYRAGKLKLAPVPQSAAPAPKKEEKKAAAAPAPEQPKPQSSQPTKMEQKAALM